MKLPADKRKRLIILIALCVVAILLAVLLLFPLITWLAQPGTQDEIQSWVAGLGWVGVVVMFLLQILQVVVAVIPGEVVELIAGVLYGGFGGLVICVVGCYIATLIVCYISHRFGQPLLRKLFGEEELEKYDFLKDSRKLETVTFILFLIPGIPKDIITYIVGVGPIKPRTFALIATLARIPAIAGATYIGSDLLSGNWVAVLILFVIVAAAGLLGIHYKDRILVYTKRLGKNSEH